MKKLVLAALLGFFLLSACKETKTKPKEKKTDDYRKEASETKPEQENGTGEYDISAPAGWTKIDTFMMGRRMIFVRSPRENASDDFLENVNVVTESTSGMQMDEYLAKSINALNSGLNGFVQGKISDRSINGIEFKYFRYSHVYNGGIPIDVDVYFTSRNGTAYIITGSAKGGTISKWEPLFDEVIRSFRLN